MIAARRRITAGWLILVAVCTAGVFAADPPAPADRTGTITLER